MKENSNDFSKDNDRLIWCKLKTYDERAWREFYNKYSWYVGSIVNPKAKRYNIDPEDISAMVFMAILLGINSYDPEKGSLHTWIGKITINVIINLLKKKINSNNLFSEYNYNLISQSNYSQELDSNYVIEHYKYLVKNLPSKYIQIIELHLFHQLTIPELSLHLDLNPNTVKTRLIRGLKYYRLLVNK